MRYLDQERECGEELVRFCGVAAQTPERGNPSAVSLRDHHMAVTALRIEDAPPGVEAQEFGSVHLVRGCCRVLTVACSELLLGTQFGGSWQRHAPRRWPTYVFIRARQSLGFELAHARVPFNLRVFWQRLERLP